MKRVIYVLVIISLLSGLIGVVGCEVKSSKSTVGELILAKDIYSAYAADKIKADEEYKGRILLQLQGTVNHTGEDSFNNPYILLGSEEEWVGGGVRCLFEDEGDISSLSKGDKITVKGKCSGCIPGNVIIVILKDCSLVS